MAMFSLPWVGKEVPYTGLLAKTGNAGMATLGRPATKG